MQTSNVSMQSAVGNTAWVVLPQHICTSSVIYRVFTPNVPCCCRFHSQSCSSTAGESVLSCLLSSKPKATFLRISHFFPNRLNPSTAKRGVGINPRRNAGFNHKLSWDQTFFVSRNFEWVALGKLCFYPLEQKQMKKPLSGVGLDEASAAGSRFLS